MHNYVYIATSLDGFIADRDGGLDWLTGSPGPEGSDFGFAEFLGRHRRDRDGPGDLRDGAGVRRVAV